jgi:hypothetical protein
MKRGKKRKKAIEGRAIICTRATVHYLGSHVQMQLLVIHITTFSVRQTTKQCFPTILPW